MYLVFLWIDQIANYILVFLEVKCKIWLLFLFSFFFRLFHKQLGILCCNVSVCNAVVSIPCVDTLQAFDFEHVSQLTRHPVQSLHPFTGFLIIPLSLLLSVPCQFFGQGYKLLVASLFQVANYYNVAALCDGLEGFLY